MNDHESLQVVDLSNNAERLGKLVKDGSNGATVEEDKQDGGKSSSPRSHASRALPKPGLQPVDELISSAAIKNSDDPTVTLAERVLKQLFEYEARIADLEKRRMLDLKKIRKLGKENDDLKDKNQKLMEKNTRPPTLGRPSAPTSSRPPLPTRASSS